MNAREYDDGAEIASNSPSSNDSQPKTQISVTQEIEKVEGGKVTAVEIEEVKGDIQIDIHDKEWERDRSNKLTLLRRVKAFWIRGILERSLHGAFLIEIGKQEEAKAVEHPWSKVLSTPDQPNFEIPSDEKIIEIFDDACQNLLLLGEPGSGKTTEMLELARDAIVRAEKDPSMPIPVVFNLSSWAGPEQSLIDWLIGELNEKYKVRKKTSREWVENRDLMLLMDGLDEVKPEHRKSCVEVINQFIQEGSCPIAVCSRIQEYNALKVLLKLNTAILLQPLSNEQIEYFLDAGGSKLSGLKDVLKEDSSLRELAKTPLMLSVMGLAFEDEPIDRMTLERASLEEHRKHIFESYASKMFSRESRSKSEQFTREQTIEWLSWLAERMREAGQTIFLLEGMQPTWLKSRSEIWMYSIFLGLSSGIFLFFYIFLSFFGILLDLSGVLVVDIELLIDVLIAWLLIDIFIFFWVTLKTKFIKTKRNLKIQPRERIKWSPNTIIKKVIKDFNDTRKFKNSIIIILFVIFSIVISLYNGDYAYLYEKMLTFLFFAIWSLFFSGFSVEEIENKTYPNQGIWVSIKNCLKYILYVNLPFVIIFSISYFYGSWNSDSYIFLALCLSVSSILGFKIGGGEEVMRHYSLRLGLYLSTKTPWNYVKFLDSCVDRILLQKVGGGYIFIHRMLMEYFADLENISQKRDE